LLFSKPHTRYLAENQSLRAWENKWYFSISARVPQQVSAPTAPPCNVVGGNISGFIQKYANHIHVVGSRYLPWQTTCKKLPQSPCPLSDSLVFTTTLQGLRQLSVWYSNFLYGNYVSLLYYICYNVSKLYIVKCLVLLLYIKKT
jgi:hypothetical protein